jgi:hypothetical protein
VPLNQWSQVVGRSNGITNEVYINGVLKGSAVSNTLTDATSATLSLGGWSGYEYNGLLTNVQLYNATLSANDIQDLYNEGIGGAPIKISNLVGWWPLNGNANDYSGNGNNGASAYISYTQKWLSAT